MKSIFFLLLVAFATGSSTFGADTELRQPAEWAEIIYPGIHPPALPGEPLNLRITRSTPPAADSILSEPQGLKCTFDWNSRNGGDGIKIFESKSLKAKLHYPGGRIVDPVFQYDPSITMFGSGICYQTTFTFPFGENNLEEAWLELAINGRSDWFEIPYGLTLPPGAPPPPSDPKGPDQAPAPAMKNGTGKDSIVRWAVVRYASRTIQKGWKLELEMTHSGDIRCLVRLRRESGRWDIPTPVTRVELKKDGGENLDPFQIGSRIPDFVHAPNVREDEFTFGYDCTLGGRLWGDLSVFIDDERQTFTIPLGFFLVGIWIDPWSSKPQ